MHRSMFTPAFFVLPGFFFWYSSSILKCNKDYRVPVALLFLYLVIGPLSVIGLVDEHDLVLVFLHGGPEHVWNGLVRPFHVDPFEENRKPSVQHSEILREIFFRSWLTTTSRNQPDRPFHNFRAWKSGDCRIQCQLRTTDFLSSKAVKGFFGNFFRGRPDTTRLYMNKNC